MEQIARVRLVRAPGIVLHAVRSSSFRKEEGRLTGSGVDKGKGRTFFKPHSLVDLPPVDILSNLSIQC